MKMSANFSILYKQRHLNSSATVFLDPNLLSKDGTVSVTSTVFSEDGTFMAYALSSEGSDWVTVKVQLFLL